MMNNIYYYNNLSVLMNLTKSMQYRINAFLNVTDSFNYNVHNVVVSSPLHIKENMRRFYFHNRNYNIYSSVASYDFSLLNKNYEFPPFSYNIKKRGLQGEMFNDTHINYLLRYDFVLDFDVKKDFEKTYNEVKIIKNQFDVYNIPYFLRFSGSGFHIIIPYKYLPVRESIQKLMIDLKSYANLISKIYNIDSLDTGIYDLRRIIKTPYSIDLKTGLVCYPLNNSEFERFSKNMCLPGKIIQKTDLEFNSMKKHNTGDSMNFIKFVIECLGVKNGWDEIVSKNTSIKTTNNVR